MKIGVITSLLAHTLVLSWGLLTISAPKPLNVADVEALPVDIIPIEAVTKTIQGDQKAALADTPAPKPTEKPVIEEKAVNIGETKIDTKSPRDAKPSPRPVEAAAPPKSAPEPKVKPKETAEVKQEEAPEQVPAPTTELAAEPEPKVKVAAITPEEQAPVSREAESLPQDEFKKLPDIVPTPLLRPARAQAKTAKTNQRKEAEKPASKQAKAAPKSNSKKKADRLAALLNRQEAAASGAKRSNKRASLGTRMSQSQMDALRGKIQGCFNLTAGMADAEELRATVRVRLKPSGELDGRPKVTASGGQPGVRRAFMGAAKRAVQRCAPYDELPKDQYETWSELIVNFDVSDML